MKIKHKEVRPGFETLRVYDDSGQFLFGVGVILPGEYPLGVHPHQAETLQVLSGSMDINGLVYTPGTDPCLIKVGDNVIVKVNAPSIYKRT